MSDELNLTPELTLDPAGSAAAQAPAPELTLDPTPAADTASAEEQAAIQKERDANAVKLD